MSISTSKSIISILLALALTGICVYSYKIDILSEKNNNIQTDYYAEKNDSTELIETYLQKQADDSYLELNIDSKIFFDDNDDSCSMNFMNSMKNKYVMQVTVHIENQVKPIFQSDIIHPGEIVTEGKLNWHLSDDKYESSIVVQFFDVENTSDSLAEMIIDGELFKETNDNQ
ncbi:hypothetical protein FUT28_11520 [Enterococcus durans]|nr:hypothetical protein [Enterococcus durans]NJE64946.1 hypothetical protein [Enterococcus durans]QED59104.1 hypothetical protein FS851_03945 [Enterococcus durans]QED63015.1 hypothetical protein FUT28_11520 [Enterococcus durans]